MADESVAPWTDGSNPLASDSPAVWDRLMEAVGPASLLVVIESRMGPRLRRRMSPEDIWQETLLSAWRDRAKCEWRGLRSFRNWLLTIIDHRIRDAVEYENAAKRGGENAAWPSSSLSGESSDRSHARPYPGPVGSTTPSRVAMHREQAAAMRAALETLPEDLREVVRLRLFEQLTVDEVAQRLQLGGSAVRHRFRKGAEIYQRLLMNQFATTSLSLAQKTVNGPTPDSAPIEREATEPPKHGRLSEPDA